MALSRFSKLMNLSCKLGDNDYETWRSYSILSVNFHIDYHLANHQSITEDNAPIQCSCDLFPSGKMFRILQLLSNIT